MNEATLGTLTTVQAFGLFQVFLRIAALFTVAPVLGSREIPAPVRIALAGLIAIVVYPLAAPFVSAPPADLLQLAAVVVRETAIGLLIGLTVSMLLSAVQVAGDLIDTQIGFGMAMIFNPALGAQTAILGNFLHRYAVIVFLLLNGHHLLLEGVIASFRGLPAERLHFAPDVLMPLVGDLAATLLAAGLRIAAPVVASLVLVDVTLALLSRAVPQMNVFVVGMPLKVIVGLVVLALAMGLITLVLQNYLGDAAGQTLPLVRVLGRP